MYNSNYVSISWCVCLCVRERERGKEGRTALQKYVQTGMLCKNISIKDTYTTSIFPLSYSPSPQAKVPTHLSHSQEGLNDSIKYTIA